MPPKGTNKYLPEIPNALRDDKDPSKTGLSGFEKGIDNLGMIYHLLNYSTNYCIYR